MDKKRLDIYDIVSGIYHNSGSPGAFTNFAKIKQVLKDKNYKFTDTEIKAALKRIDSYTKFLKRRRVLPRHVPRRFTNISHSDLWWFCDSFQIKGFKGPYKYVTLYVDSFSKEYFARPLVKLKADINARSFNEIIREDNNGILPRAIVCDRGSEMLGAYSANLKDKGVKQIFTKSSQASKAYLAERGVRTLKKMLAKMLAEGYRDFKTTLASAVKTYNNSVHSRLGGLTPKEAGQPENLSKVLNTYQKRKLETILKYGDKFDKMNSRFKEGQIVRYKLPTPNFSKETAREALFTEELYRIVKVIRSSPVYGYKLSPIDNENNIVASTFLPEQLLEA